MSEPNKNNALVGIVHPGQMGVSLGSALVQTGHQVLWASENRSPESFERAQAAKLQDRSTLGELSSHCSVILSVCPPDQAVNVARSVSDTGYSGSYIDCNAVSPATAHAVQSSFKPGQVNFVDGGIIGPPAKQSGTTRLYLSGDNATDVAALFDDSIVDARVVGTQAGAASALKMAYAGWTKGSAALLMNQFALAKQQGVDDALMQEWALSIPGLSDRLAQAASGNAPKAWRFVGEMNEIADTLEQAGLPRQWFEGAAENYARLAGFKNQHGVDLQSVVDSLLSKD
ncbi:MAG: DUF1932 domain-containing protein [Gammaproteobacteria bacterium]|nr:DUF1932 domain-containing protein [Gammaproteobacteria bacterium]